MALAGHMIALASGAAIGAVFFGGLYWTTRRAVRSSRGHAWLLASFLVRTAAAAGGFALLAMRGWQAAAVGLLGFVAVRVAMTSLLRRPGQAKDRDRAGAAPPGEARHGP